MRVKKFPLLLVLAAAWLLACPAPVEQQRKPTPRQVAGVRGRSADAFADLEAAERGQPMEQPRREVERDLEKPPPPKPEPPPKPYQEKPVDSVQVNPSRAAPAWVNSQPNMPGYYVGIGVAVSHGDEEADWKRARNNAYVELASTLKVHINSVITDYFREKNLRLYKGDSIEKDASRQDSSYSTDTKFFVDQTLEGVEIADRWKDNQQNKYWMLVRLSKAEIQRRLRERLERARKKAVDYATAARRAEAAGHIGEALRGYFSAYLALREYFGGVVEYDLDGNGRPEVLNHEIERAVQRLVAGLEWQVPEPKRRAVVGGGLAQPLEFSVTFAGKPVANLPVAIAFQRGTGTAESHVTTGPDGGASARVLKVFGEKQAILAAMVDASALVEADAPFKLRLVQAKFGNDLQLKTGKFFVELEELAVFMNIREENLGQEVRPGTIAAELREKLHAALGMVFTSSPRGADMEIRGSASTGECSDFMAQRMCVAAVTLTVVDRLHNRELFSKKYRIRGNGANDEIAGREALRRAGPRIARQIIEQFK